MKSKLYYDDPIISAYMAREFGVRYEDNAGYIKSGERFSITKFFGFYPDQGGFGLQLAKDIRSEYHIHPDSYSVFEPIVWDTVEWDGIMFGTVIGKNEQEGIIGVQHGSNDEGGCDVYELDLLELTIIQRDDKAFFMPLEVKK